MHLFNFTFEPVLNWQWMVQLQTWTGDLRKGLVIYLVLSTFFDINLSLYTDVLLKSFYSPCESTITEYFVFMLLQIQFKSHVVKSCTAFLFCSAASNTSFNESVLEFFVPTVAKSAAYVHYEDKTEAIYDVNEQPRLQR